MPRIYDSLYHWARRRTTSFADLLVTSVERGDPPPAAGPGLIYKLRQWPDLTPEQKTADVLRTLSVMSHRPVNRTWILSSSRLKPKEVDLLLQRLVEQEAVEVIDSGRFSGA